MSSLKDLASLIMIPSLYKDGELHTVKPLADENIIVHPDATDNNDGVDGTTPSTSSNFTFSRGSNLAATRVDVNGLIEKGRENLLLQSNQFDTTWYNINSTETSGQLGYDGSNNAWKLTKTSSGAYLRQNLSASNVLNFSIYAKSSTDAGDSQGIWLLINGNPDAWGKFNLSNGTFTLGTGATISAAIVSVGNGWYRCSVQTDGGAQDVRLYPSNASGDYSGTSGSIYIQDAQLEQGLVATDYIETTTTSVSAGILEDMPRLDYSGSCPSLLLEPQRTNQCSHSEYIGDSDWNQSGITRSIVITQTSETNPEGGSICWKIQGTSSNNQLANNSTTTSGTTITNSIYVKRVSGTGNVLLRDVNNNQASFSLSVADGWKRLDKTATATSTTARFYLNLVDFNDEILVWGAQQEVGSYPTSYIPTYGTSQTRSFDSCLATSVSDLIGQTQGTMLVDFVFNGNPTSVDYSIMILGAIGSNYITIGGYNKSLYARVFNSTSQGTINALQMVAGTRYKVAVAYAENDVVMYVNGVNEGSDTSVSIPALSQVGFTRPSFEHSADVKQSLVFPTRLTNAELAALTTL